MSEATAPVLSTSELVAAFLASKAGRKPRTVQNYSYTLKAFAEAMPSLPDRPEGIESWLFRREWSPSTKLSYYGQLTVFYNWLVRRGRIATNPMPLIERPIVEDEPPALLNLEELVHLLTHPSHPQRERTLLYFLADTGWRLGEAANLDRYSSMPDGIVRASHGKRGGRLTPISGPVYEMLAALPRHPEHPEWVWWGKKGRLTTDYLGHLITDCFRSAGFHGPRYSAHCLRHTFATLWEGDELILQQILGHKKLAMTSRYRQYRTARAQAQHALYSPLARVMERGPTPEPEAPTLLPAPEMPAVTLPAAVHDVPLLREGSPVYLSLKPDPSNSPGQHVYWYVRALYGPKERRRNWRVVRVGKDLSPAMVHAYNAKLAEESARRRVLLQEVTV